MNTNVHFAGMDSTDALNQYARDRAEDLTTYFDGITGIDVHIGRESQHHQKGKVFFAEFKVQIPNQPPVVVKKDSDDLYKAMDKVKDHMKIELEKIKGKMNQIDREVLSEQKAYHPDDD